MNQLAKKRIGTSRCSKPVKELTQKLLISMKSEMTGGYSGFQMTGMVKGFFGGLKFSISGFFWVGKFWQVFFWVASVK